MCQQSRQYRWFTNCKYFWLKNKKANVCTLDTAHLRETPPQKRSGMTRVLKGSHSFTCTPTRLIRNRNEPYLPLPFNCSWYSFTDSGWIEGWVGLPTDSRFYYFAGWVGLGGWLRSETVYHPARRQSPIRLLTRNSVTWSYVVCNPLSVWSSNVIVLVIAYTHHLRTLLVTKFT